MNEKYEHLNPSDDIFDHSSKDENGDVIPGVDMAEEAEAERMQERADEAREAITDDQIAEFDKVMKDPSVKGMLNAYAEDSVRDEAKEALDNHEAIVNVINKSI